MVLSGPGVLYHVNESGNCVEVLQADGGIKRLLHHESRNLLVVITESLVLGQFSVAADGSVTEINRVTLLLSCNNSCNDLFISCYCIVL